MTNSPIEYKELVKEPYLEILGFSAFQLDSFSGFYGGEVRLALYFDGKKLTPVSGFSISGNLFDDFKNMKSHEIADIVRSQIIEKIASAGAVSVH